MWTEKIGQIEIFEMHVLATMESATLILRPSTANQIEWPNRIQATTYLHIARNSSQVGSRSLNITRAAIASSRFEPGPGMPGRKSLPPSCDC